MKYLLVLFFLNTTLALSNSADLNCKTQILQFYGLGGLIQPYSYHNLVKQLNVDHCPGIEYSCCSFVDFKLTKTIWDTKVDVIKSYLTKIFKIIQKTTLLQETLLQIANLNKDKAFPSCRQVDSTFFNNPIHYDEIYFYLQNAFDAFAYMQKGFYCTICDAKNHQYLGLMKGSTRKVAVIDVKFCNDLIFFFREYIMFKVYFLDPMIINTNNLLNCHAGENKYDFKFEYLTNYQMIQSCVEKGENCEFVCKEFRFGGASELFVGKVGKLYEFFNNLQNILLEYNPALKNEIDSEFKVDTDDISSEFFTDITNQHDPEVYSLLKDFNLSEFEINIESKGINMFDISTKSNYFLTNARTRGQIIKNFGIHVPTDGTTETHSMIDSEINEDSEKSMATSKLITNYKDEDNWEKKHQLEKMSQDPHTPSTAEVETMVMERDRLEQEMANEIKAKGTVEYQNGVGEENFGAAFDIPNSATSLLKIIGVIMSITILIFVK